MKLIKDWRNKTLICSDCNAIKSVKYEHNNKTYCSLCMAKERIKEMEKDSNTKNNVL